MYTMQHHRWESDATFLDEVDEIVGGAVMAGDGVGAAQFRLNHFGQLFPKLHSATRACKACEYTIMTCSGFF